jgi:hypothetical protein
VFHASFETSGLLPTRTCRRLRWPHLAFWLLPHPAGGLPVLGVDDTKALPDHRDKLREIQDNQLYFYYRAGERLRTRLG